MYPWLARSRPPCGSRPRTPGSQRQLGCGWRPSWRKQVLRPVRRPGARSPLRSPPSALSHSSGPPPSLRAVRHRQPTRPRGRRAAPRPERQPSVHGRPRAAQGQRRREAHEAAEASRDHQRPLQRGQRARGRVGHPGDSTSGGPGHELRRPRRRRTLRLGWPRPGGVRLRTARSVGRGRPGRRRPDGEHEDPLHDPRRRQDGLRHRGLRLLRLRRAPVRRSGLHRRRRRSPVRLRRQAKSVARHDAGLALR